MPKKTKTPVEVVKARQKELRWQIATQEIKLTFMKKELTELMNLVPLAEADL